MAPLRNLLNQEEFDLDTLLAVSVCNLYYLHLFIKKECLAPYFTRTEVVNFLGKKLGKNELMAVLLRDRNQIEKVVGMNTSLCSNVDAPIKKIPLFSENSLDFNKSIDNPNVSLLYHFLIDFSVYHL